MFQLCQVLFIEPLFKDKDDVIAFRFTTKSGWMKKLNSVSTPTRTSVNNQSIFTIISVNNQSNLTIMHYLWNIELNIIYCSIISASASNFVVYER